MVTLLTHNPTTGANLHEKPDAVLNPAIKRSDLQQEIKNERTIFTLADCDKAPLNQIITKDEYSKLLKSNPPIVLMCGKKPLDDVIELVITDKNNPTKKADLLATFYTKDNQVIPDMSDKIKVEILGTQNQFISVTTTKTIGDQVNKNQSCIDQLTGHKYELHCKGKVGESFIDQLKIVSIKRQDGEVVPAVYVGKDNKDQPILLTFFKADQSKPDYPMVRWRFDSTLSEKGVQFTLETIPSPGDRLLLANQLPYIKFKEDQKVEYIPRDK
jgi:hypothetical protein